MYEETLIVPVEKHEEPYDPQKQQYKDIRNIRTLEKMPFGVTLFS